MIFVYVGSKYKLVLATQDFFCKLHADLMGLFRCDLPRLKGLDQVAAQVCSLVDGMVAGPGKFDTPSHRRIQAAFRPSFPGCRYSQWLLSALT